MDYQLILSARRKSICLMVKEAKIIVRAPKNIDNAVIEKLLFEKRTWLKEKINQQTNLVSLKTTFNNGSNLWVQGKCKKLIIDYGKHSEIIENEQTVTLVSKVPGNKKLTEHINTTFRLNSTDLITSVNTSLSVANTESIDTGHTEHSCGQKIDYNDSSAPFVISPKQVKVKLEKWLKIKAQSYILERVNELSKQCQLYPKACKIRQYKARWGSCNSQGQLNFNYLLMMTPSWVVDYVIVHELCHLQHLNHSREFWLLVNKHYPKYAEAKLWLKQHQQHLTWSL
jgi:hypothetical protein